MSVWYAILNALGLPMFEMDFMKNALLAVLLMAPLFGLLSTMIVTGRMSFFSDALGHSGFTGIAIGALCGAVQPLSDRRYPLGHAGGDRAAGAGFAGGRAAVGIRVEPAGAHGGASAAGLLPRYCDEAQRDALYRRYRHRRDAGDELGGTDGH